MIIQLAFNEKNYSANLDEPLDISIPLREGKNNPSCYWADPVKFETIESGNFIGSVARGGSVNYQKLTLTPHGNGTHTECYGHITADGATINETLRRHHFFAELISVEPVHLADGDFVITREAIQQKIKHKTKALVIRTLPNTPDKKSRQYSGTNPPYLQADAVLDLVDRGIEHLVLDLPSVDKEVDGGKLAGHRAFWKLPHAPRTGCTITELVFIDWTIPDGLYLMNLQVLNLEMDASPSRPVLYKLAEVL
jgi:kynurenine formamidase